jgi:hypothetical protein
MILANEGSGLVDRSECEAAAPSDMKLGLDGEIAHTASLALRLAILIAPAPKPLLSAVARYPSFCFGLCLEAGYLLGMATGPDRLYVPLVSNPERLGLDSNSAVRQGGRLDHFREDAGLAFLNSFVHLATICATRLFLSLSADRYCWENLPHFAPICLISAEVWSFASSALGVTLVISILNLGARNESWRIGDPRDRNIAPGGLIF